MQVYAIALYDVLLLYKAYNIGGNPLQFQGAWGLRSKIFNTNVSGRSFDSSQLINYLFGGGGLWDIWGNSPPPISVYKRKPFKR